MKKIIFFIFIYFFTFILFPVQAYSSSKTSYVKEKVTIVLVSDLTLNDDIFKSTGIYSFIHVNPQKNYKDLFLDIQETTSKSTVITTNEYLSWGYKSNYTIILIKDIKKNELHKFLNFKTPDRTIILTSLSNIINPIYIESNQTGILYSSATKREGFIKYTDLLYLLNNIDNLSMTSIYFTENSNPILFLQNLYTQNISLLYGRYLLIGYIFMAFLCFLRLNKSRIFFGYLIFLCPILSSIYGFYQFNYLNGVGKSVVIIIVSIILGAFLYHLNLNYKKAFMIMWISTLLLLFYFTFSHIYLYKSPLGFNNIFNGTRFYGWNNDLIGIFLGTLLSLFYISKHIKKKFFCILLIFFFGICIICFSPMYGANVGGMLSCFFAIILCIFYLENSIIKKFFYISITILGFIFIQNYFINWDLRQTSATHWGIWIQSVHNKEFSFSLKIIYTKIKQIFFFLILFPLNIFLFLQWIFLFKLKILEVYDEKWRKIFFIITLIVIFLNDSGVLSSIIMNFYFIISIYCFSFYDL